MGFFKMPDHIQNPLKMSSRASFYAARPSVIINLLSLGLGGFHPLCTGKCGAQEDTHTAHRARLVSLSNPTHPDGINL